MATRNGAKVTPDETHDHLINRVREDSLARADIGGFVNPGKDPYAGEWNIDLSWTKAEDVEDPVGAGLRVPAKYEVDATFVVGKRDGRNGRMRSSTLKRVRITDEKEVRQLREASVFNMSEGYPDPFAYGSANSASGGQGVLGQYLPLWPGPVTRQLYWQDYWQMSAKSFEAYNHDPISWRSIHMKGEFALGKGLQARATYSRGSQKQGQAHVAAQQAWDEFWERNKMDNRLDMISRDLSWGGEQFLRYFQKGRLLTVRSLDPASIYDIITDPEDHETVFAYHQQFQTPYQLYPPTGTSPPGGPAAPTGPTQAGTSVRYIIRQILPQEIDHYKLNASAFERRGRSDLFPALGWIKRLRDYLTSHVIRADMLARICWDLEVHGNQSAVTQLRALLFPQGQAPPPGTVFGHNQASKLTAVVPTGASGGSRYDPVMDALVTMAADAVGVPKEWLGFGMGTTRANALVATEPATRSLEALQGTMETILHDCFDRVMAAAKINDAEAEFTFPSIATEDRSQKLQDLAYAESNMWIAKQTAASIAAKELGISTYDYVEEQKLMAQEFPEPEMEDDSDAPVDPLTGKKPQKPKQGDGTIRRQMIVASLRQSPKLDPTKSVSGQEDEPMGQLVPYDGSQATTPPGGGAPGGAPPGKPGAGQQPTRNGVPANQNPNSAAGAASIKTDLKTKEARRRAEDPEYTSASENYREASARNLAELARAAIDSEVARHLAKKE